MALAWQAIQHQLMGVDPNERTVHSQACTVTVTAQSSCGAASYIHCTVLSCFSLPYDPVQSGNVG